MSTTTPNLGLTKPTPADPADRNVWGATLNSNLDALDAIFKSDGTGSSVGLKVGSGKTLAVAGTITVPTKTAGANTPDAASCAFVQAAASAAQAAAVSTSEAYTDAAVAGVQSAFIGELRMIAYSSPETKWLLCDGSTKSRTTYAALFAKIGTTFNTGGEAGTDFRLPDMRGRVPAGVDTAGLRLGSGVTGGITGTASLGASGGEQKHTLTATEQASMGVSVGVSGSISGSAGIPGSTGGDGGNFTLAGPSQSNGSPTNYPVTGTFSGTGSGTAAGGGQAHNVTQPTLVINFMIYAGA